MKTKNDKFYMNQYIKLLLFSIKIKIDCNTQIL